MDRAPAPLQTIDLTLPPRQGKKQIEGVVLWSNGTPAGDVQITLEDPRWSWDIFNVVATTDSDGRFTVSALDGTRYRVHAVGQRAAESFTSGPVDVEPGTTPVKVRLVLSRKGFLQVQDDQPLKAWRNGRGLRWLFQESICIHIRADYVAPALLVYSGTE